MSGDRSPTYSTEPEEILSGEEGPVFTLPSPFQPSSSPEGEHPVHEISSGPEEDPTPTETVPAKRKRGRPRKDKAPVDPATPKRGRGRPRKSTVEVAGASSSRAAAPEMVTYEHFHAAHWEHYHRIMLQGERISALEKRCEEAEQKVKLQDQALVEIMNFLEGTMKFKPSGPSS